NSRKRNIDLVDVTENSSESEEEHATNREEKKVTGIMKLLATIVFLKKTWARGKPAKLEAHLANECPNCPENISRYWCEKVAERNSKKKPYQIK
ncbi:1681_t:CDS:2, partial [Gigaspora margarita]